MNRHRCIALVCISFALCVPQVAQAWGPTGHKVVAGIAWDNMTSAARTKAVETLKKAPPNACLKNLFSNVTSRPRAVREREFFILAATWPDIVRGQCTSFNRPPWHFFDHFWEGVSGETGASAPRDNITIPPKTPNAVERLNTFRHSVSCDSGPCSPPEQRATELAWILHLVGDIHQPLHDAARVTSAPGEADGDNGGNEFLLAGNPGKLHSYWDGIVDKSIPRNPGEQDLAYVTRVLGMIEADHPRTSLAAGMNPGNFEAWSQEGFDSAKEFLYPKTLRRQKEPSEDYRKMAFALSDKSIAFAGYRLADLLNTMLDGQGVVPPPPPPESSPHLPSPSHIVIVIDENKKFSDVIGPAPKAPFINALAARGALLNFFALHHPSQPNYMELFAGQRLGVCADECPIGPFTDQNLGAALIAAGKSFAGFAENLPAQPRLACSGLFRAKHAPWVDFANIPASASKDFATEFPKTPAGFDQLPDVSFVIPNMNDDMHDGSGIAAEVATGNTWLRNNLRAYADWAVTHNSLLIVTWDEDSSKFKKHCPTTVITTAPPANHIATIIMGEPVRSGQTPSDQYTHHDLLRTILDMYGIPPFAGAATAKDITGIWR
jgi:acid phosphatase